MGKGHCGPASAEFLGHNMFWYSAYILRRFRNILSETLRRASAGSMHSSERRLKSQMQLLTAS